MKSCAYQCVRMRVIVINDAANLRGMCVTGAV